MSLQFTQVRSFVLRADFSTVDVDCVTIKWQQMLKGFLQVTVVGVLPHVSAERRCIWQVMQQDMDY